MFGSSILEVAIGLVFIYLFLSLICSVITEWYSRFRSLRAANLERGIRKLLNDTDNGALTEKLYNHTLIKGITRDGHKPSYISSRFFALALMDIVAHGEVCEKANSAPQASSAQSKILTDFRSGLTEGAKLPEELKRTLLHLTHTAENDLKEARRHLENWFDEAMERVSGWYKKTAQFHSIVIAVIVTLILNADTVFISKALYKDNTLRSSLVTAAQETAKSSVDNASVALGRINDNITNISMPLGWPDPVICGPKSNKGSLFSFYQFLSKLLGWTITAIAVSLGAPFWFDMLNKLVNIRSAGKEPAKTTVKQDIFSNNRE